MGISERVNERVDFALQILPTNGSKGLKIVFEVDGVEHEGEQKYLDKARDKALKEENWMVERFKTSEMDKWEDRIRELCEKIFDAIPKNIIDAARLLRRSPVEDYGAISSLILLPQAEGRLLQAISLILYEGEHQEITISDRQKANLSPVIEQINTLVSNLWNVHGKKAPLIKIVEGDADIVCYVTPCAMMWKDILEKKGVVGPSSIPSHKPPSILDALPRPIIIDINEPQSMRTLLNYIFRMPDFRLFQLQIIARALSQEKVVALLPTAAGKSLCYQLASMLQPFCQLPFSNNRLAEPSRFRWLSCWHQFEPVRHRHARMPPAASATAGRMKPFLPQCEQLRLHCAPEPHALGAAALAKYIRLLGRVRSANHPHTASLKTPFFRTGYGT